jgi:hypothetical protein
MLASVAAFAAIAGALLWLMLRRPPAADELGQSWCAGWYRGARTAAESAAVDRYQPQLSKVAGGALRCDELRAMARRRAGGGRRPAS